jgi:hypothetical protein
MVEKKIKREDLPASDTEKTAAAKTKATAKSFIMMAILLVWFVREKLVGEFE